MFLLFFVLCVTDGHRIAKSTPVDLLMQQDFHLVINDQTYAVSPSQIGKSSHLVISDQTYAVSPSQIGKSGHLVINDQTYAVSPSQISKLGALFTLCKGSVMKDKQ